MDENGKAIKKSERSRQYIAIDLKSYYASVECVDRQLDPLTTNLVVADTTRTEKTICLAVSPSLKALGVPGRPRLFEVIQKVKEINAQRLLEATRRKRAVSKRATIQKVVTKKGKAESSVKFSKGNPGCPEIGLKDKTAFPSASFDACALKNDCSLELSYIIAPPRMARYEEVSAQIYGIYLKYISSEDILVYSIDEVFMDVTDYLNIYQMDAWELAMTMIRDVLYTTGITATAGVGTNMFLAKIAMDIVAKRAAPDKDGVRIASLDELSFRRLLWNHEPLTDFWRIGRGVSRRLHRMGLYTLGDVARCSLGREDEYYNEDLLYKAFGINAELLIDHAWGWEPCRMSDVKAYVPKTNSISTGQVLPKPYTFEKARNVIMEMTDTLALDLVKKGLCTNRIELGIGYETEALGLGHGGIHAEKTFSGYISGTREITNGVLDIFDENVDPALFIRRIGIAACNVKPRAEVAKDEEFHQLSLFVEFSDQIGVTPNKSDVYEKDKSKKRQTVKTLKQGRNKTRKTVETLSHTQNEEEKRLSREKELRLQEAVLRVKRHFGKNALIRGINLKEDAREMERNEMIGGHRA